MKITVDIEILDNNQFKKDYSKAVDYIKDIISENDDMKVLDAKILLDRCKLCRGLGQVKSLDVIIPCRLCDGTGLSGGKCCETCNGKRCLGCRFDPELGINSHDDNWIRADKIE